jgi:two-component system sensor histidine kinase AlgZ
MITYNIYTALIILSILTPIAGAITLFMVLAFEHEIDFLKSENLKINLEKELKHSEYMQLNQQIQPHFLFNTMNLLLGLARLKKNDQLIEVLEHLSMFLKFKYKIKEQLIPFSKELEYTKHYLTIQKIRFGQRLKVYYELEQNESIHTLVPPYMLQILVENAFKHGLEKKIGEAVLTIRFKTDENTASLEVVDNGMGVKTEIFDLEASQGHGLKNILKRLNLLFDEQASVTLRPVENGGTSAIVSWPVTYAYE